MKRDRLPYIFIPLVAFFAVHPLIAHGCSCGHDFDFHIVNWFEAARQLAHGHYPQWVATPAWNAGEPRFVFYPPLSWLLGALLGVIMPWTWTPIAYTWLALTVSGLALHSAARDLKVPPNAALLAAVVYTVNPYMLYTAYERTAYAELLAAAWLPLLLAGALRDRPTIRRIAIPIALLWLTNAPAAVMGCYALALVAVVRLATNPGAPPLADGVPGPLAGWGRTRRVGEQTLQLTTTYLVGTLLGLGLASFYLIPAAYERRWVQIKMAILPGMRFSDNFLFHRIGDADHDTVLHTASIVALVMITLTAATLLLALKRTPRAPGLRALTILAVVVVFLLTPLSAPIWSHTPDLPFLQFPWRLLAILAAVFGLTLADALPAATPRATAIVSVAIAVVFTLPAYHAFRQQCWPEDTVSARLATFVSANPASDPTDEYTPNGADNDSLTPNNPPWWLAQDPNAAAPKNPAQDSGPAPRSLDLNLASPQTLILNLRDYPAWRITINNTIVSTHAHRKDGLLAIPLPAGPAQIHIAWHNTPDHITGDIISILALAVTTILLLRACSLSETFRANTN